MCSSLQFLRSIKILCLCGVLGCGQDTQSNANRSQVMSPDLSPPTTLSPRNSDTSFMAGSPAVDAHSSTLGSRETTIEPSAVPDEALSGLSENELDPEQRALNGVSSMSLMDTDGNDSAADAVSLEEGLAMGVIETPGDRDYYNFLGYAGQWVVLETQANREDDPSKLDTVIRLFDQEMRLIAENDDRFPRVGTDSEIIIRLPDTSRYLVEVTQSPALMPSDGASPVGSRPFGYTLTMGIFNDELQVVTLATEVGDQLNSATPLRMANGFGLVAGLFDTPGDLDVYRLAISGRSEQSLMALAMPHGSQAGFGSTSSVAKIWLTSEDGSTLIARTDDGLEDGVIHPTVTNTNYLLWISHGGEALGGNDFYTIKIFHQSETQGEGDDEENNSIAGARDIALSEGVGARTSFVRAQLELSDHDVFAVELAADESLSVSCSALNIGSGVRHLRVELLDHTENLLSEGLEQPGQSATATLENPGPGRYFLRLSAGGQNADLPANFVRCGIFAFSTE